MTSTGKNSARNCLDGRRRFASMKLIICPEKSYNQSGLHVILKNEGNAILSEGLVLQDADVWGKTLDETSTPFNNMMELYFEDFDIDGLLAKYESGKYFVRYATKLTELAGGQKLVRLYDPSGNLIEVRTP